MARLCAYCGRRVPAGFDPWCSANCGARLRAATLGAAVLACIDCGLYIAAYNYAVKAAHYARIAYSSQPSS